MVRLSAIFVALCMVLIAGSIGAVLYLSFGFARVEAAVVAVAMNLPEFPADHVYVIAEKRPLRVAGHLHSFPGTEVFEGLA